MEHVGASESLFSIRPTQFRAFLSYGRPPPSHFISPPSRRGTRACALGAQEPTVFARSPGPQQVRWPLSRSPIAFHQLKDPQQYRDFFACGLFNAAGRPRRFPRDLFPPWLSATDGRTANRTVVDPALPVARGGGAPSSSVQPALTACSDPWTWGRPNKGAQTRLDARLK